jgi:hypothetical protein
MSQLLSLNALCRFAQFADWFYQSTQAGCKRRPTSHVGDRSSKAVGGHSLDCV